MSNDESYYISSDSRQNPALGQLNQDRPPSTGITIDDNTRNSEFALQQVMANGIEPTCDIQFPRKAICVWSEEYVAEAGASYTGIFDVGKTLGYNPQMIRIKAYDDFIDGGSFPMPNLSAIPNQNLTAREAILYNMCPDYYSEPTWGGASIQVPSPGDIVWIDFADRQNLQGGIYKGIAEKVSIIPSSYATSALESMEDAIGIPLMELDVGAGVGEGAESNIDDLCAGPTGTNANGSVETVIVDGVPMNAAIAGFWVTMRDAAAAATPPVILTVSSAFRGIDDLPVDQSCPLDGTIDQTFKGQQTLYDGWVARNDWAALNEASYTEYVDPETGLTVSAYKQALDTAENPSVGFNLAGLPDGQGSHSLGFAFDVNTGIPAATSHETPQPALMTETYRWLLLNAHKYGFVRTVAVERWHWEYRGGGAQFQQDPYGVLTRSHPTWDNFFEEGSEGEEMLEVSREPGGVGGDYTAAEEAWEDAHDFGVGY